MLHRSSLMRRVKGFGETVGHLSKAREIFGPGRSHTELFKAFGDVRRGYTFFRRFFCNGFSVFAQNCGDARACRDGGDGP